MSTKKQKVISSRAIREYARVCAAHNRLEKLRYKIRGDLLAQLDDGYVPSTSGPFVLDKTFQARLDSDKWSWKMVATELAMKYLTAIGEEDVVAKAMEMMVAEELSAPRKNVVVLAAKPNPSLFEEFLRSQ